MKSLILPLSVSSVVYVGQELTELKRKPFRHVVLLIADIRSFFCGWQATLVSKTFSFRAVEGETRPAWLTIRAVVDVLSHGERVHGVRGQPGAVTQTEGAESVPSATRSVHQSRRVIRVCMLCTYNALWMLAAHRYTILEIALSLPSIKTPSMHRNTNGFLMDWKKMGSSGW